MPMYPIIHSLYHGGMLNIVVRWKVWVYRSGWWTVVVEDWFASHYRPDIRT